mmetsp:Transcript_2803/g.4352  ORF Transcript_2803/g.4352 Transcript_2803/m.4352 type:complete len:95 (+) Transcript_2803:409-693(+)
MPPKKKCVAARTCYVAKLGSRIQFIRKQKIFPRNDLDAIWPFGCNKWCIGDARRSTQSSKILEALPAIIAAAFRAHFGSVGWEFEFYFSTITLD